MRQQISATLITKNEGKNLERALNALSFVDEIIIADSNSDDNTKEIARQFGATIFDHDFKNYGSQKNVAEKAAKGPWILNIDADEVVSEKLRESILKLLSEPLEKCAALYEVERLNFVENVAIKHGGWNNDVIPRLYQKNKASWSEPNVHERLMAINGQSTSRLAGELYHYSFASLKDQVLTNMRYAEQGARDLLIKKGRAPYLHEILLKPLGKFIECYVLKAGFLDGRIGFFIAVNAAHSIFMKYVLASRQK